MVHSEPSRTRSKALSVPLPASRPCLREAASYTLLAFGVFGDPSFGCKSFHLKLN